MWPALIVLLSGSQEAAPTFHDLTVFYGAASVPLAMSIVVNVFQSKRIDAKDRTIEAMAAEMRDGQAEASKALSVAAERLADANAYLKELRDQGIAITVAEARKSP